MSAGVMMANIIWNAQNAQRAGSVDAVAAVARGVDAFRTGEVEVRR